jgi:predicted adenine nucleotide alpha hydrolase (AANH) superfamily ATPase
MLRLLASAPRPEFSAALLAAATPTKVEGSQRCAMCYDVLLLW